jgi:hypothetical protein
MQFEEAQQILTAILYSASPLVSDQYGTSRRLSGIVEIVSSHTIGGKFSLVEDGRRVTLHSTPDIRAEEKKGAKEANDADV